jgi:TonB family protein
MLKFLPVRNIVLLLLLTLPVFGQSPTPSPSPVPGSVVGKTVSGEDIYLIGGDVKPPRPISHPEPEFPSNERGSKMQSVVGIEGYVGKDGKYYDAKVVHSINRNFDRAALDAVRHWKFKPGTKDGNPVNCSVYVEISFNRY